MTPPGPTGYTIERLDPAKHDRATFETGVPAVDRYFRATANKLAKADNVRFFVLTGAASEVIGFYALNAHSIDYRDLPVGYARNRPGHGMIPVAFIAMIGVARRLQGRGFGSALLIDALRRVSRAADSLGIAAVLLDVLDCGDPAATERRRALYLGYGFEPLSANPARLFLPMATARCAITEA